MPPGAVVEVKADAAILGDGPDPASAVVGVVYGEASGDGAAVRVATHMNVIVEPTRTYCSRGPWMTAARFPELLLKPIATAGLLSTSGESCMRLSEMKIPCQVHVAN